LAPYAVLPPWRLTSELQFAVDPAPVTAERAGASKMESQGSVTRLIEQLRSEDASLRDDAALRLWERYVPALLHLARHHLDKKLLRREDEDDVLQSMYASFCIRQQRGKFDLPGRDDLWKLLVTVTLRKARNAARRHRQQTRDYRRERADGDGDSNRRAMAHDLLDVTEPTPDDAAAFNDELERRLRALGDPVLRRIALYKLEGYTNKEIAHELDNCTERTIERKLARIRTKWAQCDQTTE
jgi:RNA polymerase sigma factor (sigma-70 family)